MARRVLLLSQWFDPEPTFKGLVFARELVALGYEVEVVTGFPNYPGGKIYPGYRIRWFSREQIDGVSVVRLPLYPSHDGSAAKRVANYVSFAFSAAIYCAFFAPRPDVVYAYHPPLTIGVVASLTKLVRRVPVVYDIQDLWPDTLRATGMMTNERLLRAVSRVAAWVYRRMDHIVVLSHGFRDRLVERGVAADKIDVIHNWCDEGALLSVGKSLPAGFPPDDAFRILFAGTMGRAQALDAVLAAAERLLHRTPRVRFVFVGGGIEHARLREEAQRRVLSNVTFLPKVPMNEVGDLLRAADALLVHLKADPLFRITVPGKVPAYLAIGRPILIAVQGDAAAIVRNAGCGVEAVSEDPDSIANAALLLASLRPDELAAMGQRASDYYGRHLATSVGVRHFADVFDRVIGFKELGRNGI